MVVYNEGHRIYQTISKVAPYVQEIVIVDQGSTDDTVEQIQRWQNSSLGAPVKIINDKHWGYCEPSRFLAWDNSVSEWVLALDADESISKEFIEEMFYLDDRGFRGCKMMRSFYLEGNHRFTGDYQYRYFKRECVKFLNEIHTEPQPHNLDRKRDIYSTPYAALIHTKSWREQIRDELAYEKLVPQLDTGNAKDVKLSLNVHLALLHEKGFTLEEVEKMTHEERVEKGLDTNE